MQGLDGPPGDKGDDGEAGQPVSVYAFSEGCVIAVKKKKGNCKLIHLFFFKSRVHLDPLESLAPLDHQEKE